MRGNSFGKAFCVSTFGESHGYGVGVSIDGCPSGVELSQQDFAETLEKRRPGKHALDTPRSEADEVRIVSGVFEGTTTGAPICVFVSNTDADSKPYEILRTVFRPGHADYTYCKKWGHFDFRGGGRASARETVSRVAAGVVAGKILEPAGVKVAARTIELGGIRAEAMDLDEAQKNRLCCPDPGAFERMEDMIARTRESKDSLGGIVEVRVDNCPAGLGEPVFDKLDADLAKAVMSVGAVKGVEIGMGFAASRLKGSENNDPILPRGFETNRAGGILGGVSNGEEIVLRVAVKPIPSIGKSQKTVTREGRPAELRLSGRFDVTAIPRILPVLEAMVMIVLADHYLRSRADRAFGKEEDARFGQAGIP